MWRENRDYAITVQGDVAEGLQGAPVTAELSPRLKALEAQWAQQGMCGYRIQIAGAAEESSKGSASIAAGVPIMLFITFTLLMLQLRSFSRAGVPDRRDGHRWRGRGVAAAGPAIWFCCSAGGDRADGHEPAQLRDPD